MTSADRDLRPSAKDILALLDKCQSTPEVDNSDESSDVQNLSVPNLLSIIDDLKRQLKEKDILIQQLSKSAA